MRVLVACEFSGVVRDAFTARGHDAWSCDLLPTDAPGQHIQGDVLEVLTEGWDLIVAHPPCTRLCVSGARWWKDHPGEQEEAAAFFMALYNAPCPKVGVENPIGAMSRLFRKPDQIIQPWEFGHGETKATCLWLRGLPLLQATQIVEGRHAKTHLAPDSKGRWKRRSKTYTGIAEAMADQWGGL